MKKTTLFGGLLSAALAFVCLFCSVVKMPNMQEPLLRPLDRWAADKLYTVNEISGDNRIKIIKIDEVTENDPAFGSFKSWGRDIPADLISYLNQPERKPAVIAFDINFAAERLDQKGDDALVQAAKESGNVIIASQAVFKEKSEYMEDGKVHSNVLHVAMYEYPFQALRAVTKNGFVDAIQDRDQQVRMALYRLNYEGEEIYNFSYEVYRNYCALNDLPLYVPRTDGNDIFGIHYIAGNNGYESFSWSKVVAGEYPDDVFKDSIVLVGAYMTGMQDQLKAPIARYDMNGVEIHANIIDSMLRGQSFKMVSYELTALVGVLLCLIYLLVLVRGKLSTTIVSGIVGIALYLGAAKILYEKGIFIYPAAFVLAILLMMISNIGYRYTAERLSKRKMIKEFKKYVAPQVLERMMKDGDFSVKLGGEAKDIAVLFVDIRGFTALSEKLPPEKVVEMLNEYLEHTTETIFANGGTLDKFIGDATMAVFNAPFDLPDYEMCAVKTALEIVHGAEKINAKIREKIGHEVSFGVGVNCGRAVVGNIGCETRMDYTAIGDTVNTASRLEGKAQGGQVVISEELWMRLKDRLSTEPLGEMALKGKAEPLKVYAVTGISESGAR